MLENFRRSWSNGRIGIWSARNIVDEGTVDMYTTLWDPKWDANIDTAIIPSTRIETLNNDVSYWFIQVV